MDFLLKMVLTAGLFTQSIESAPRIARLSVAEKAPSQYYTNNIEGDAGAYSFNYDISDDKTGNMQYRSEDRYSNGTVIGAYGYIDAFGVPQRYRYVADQAGYRVYKEDRFKPFYGYQPLSKPIDKVAIEPTESSITWTRPKRPNKNKNSIPLNKVGFEKYNPGNGRYNLVGPPSLYVQYD